MNNTFVFRCKLYIKHEGNTIKVKKQAAVIVSKPPTSIHIEVDGAKKSEEVINFSESKSRKVKIVVESLLGLLVLFQMYTEPFLQIATINCLEPGQLFWFPV